MLFCFLHLGLFTTRSAIDKSLCIGDIDAKDASLGENFIRVAYT